LGYTHDLAWALIGLNERADWSTHSACGWGEMVELTLDRIKQNDIQAHDAIQRALLEPTLSGRTDKVY
jgi:glycosyltransferase A (GT-A) superfamily protein (DUF2064 family)